VDREECEDYKDGGGRKGRADRGEDRGTEAEVGEVGGKGLRPHWWGAQSLKLGSGVAPAGCSQSTALYCAGIKALCFEIEAAGVIEEHLCVLS
jgi:hypothetical protein